MNSFNPDDVTQDANANSFPRGKAVAQEPPRQIGRYYIKKLIGQGGFGVVYLAQDEQLKRAVAIKVPHDKRMLKSKDAEAYIAEARIVANLDHPGIVPVYDVGSTDDFPFFMVSMYVQGTDLANRLKQQRLKYRESAELIANIAEALHYAHKQGLVHRDVKPANILLRDDGRPYVSDFGLALHEKNIGRGSKWAGTPAYMSPEQARGEGHRVDGRSDIFSLGVVFYELLAGRQPFRQDNEAELLEQVITYEPYPLLQLDEKLPKELQRICFKAMSKRATDRFSSAYEMADDLKHFLLEKSGPLALPSAFSAVETQKLVPPSVEQPASSTLVANSNQTDLSGSGSSDNRPIRIVPKGLRSFDAHDSDFFLELLPGPRNRNGLPESLRFWKMRIEETDADSTFTVGLIYGPSGCGKSSLVKAGLLPQLSKDVISVYIEATPEDTETRLLNGLRKRCPALKHDLNLKDTLASVRRGQGIPPEKKVLLVLDQFEQWLHAKKGEQNCLLAEALRECDGGRLQCIVMVRDDFWLAVSRFLRELEVRLVEGHNIALADLFDLAHARKVLAAFGRAFGRLPEKMDEATKDQLAFLKQAVAGLAEEGKVNSVRLALFAEMMKGKDWNPTTLKEAGGTQGVGAAFLEETFSSFAASPEHRYHQKAARAVLSALLPESSTDIKGSMRSYGELLEASGYENRRRDFDELISILDSEIRLITPTDPEGKVANYQAEQPTDASQKYFQLTHDYLVHSLREWLTRKQIETRQGRAEMRLLDRSTTWTARPERRFLPSWLEDVQIRMFTDRKKWTKPQQRMMRTAAGLHTLQTSLLTLLLIGLSLSTLKIRNFILEERHRSQEDLQRKENVTRSEGLVSSLLSAHIAQVPAIINDLANYRLWADPLLYSEFTNATGRSRQQLHVSLALLPVDETQRDYLFDRLLDAEPHEVPVIGNALTPFKDALLKRLLAVVKEPEKGKVSRRLRAASLLAKFPASDYCQDSAKAIVDDLVGENPLHSSVWMESLRPIKGCLQASLASIYRDANHQASERSLATSILADYASDQPDFLADLLMDADEKQFAVLFPRLEKFGEEAARSLSGELEKNLPGALTDWTIRFRRWSNLDSLAPPGDLDAALKSPVLDQFSAPRLKVCGGRDTPPAINTPALHFAAEATTEVTLEDTAYAIMIHFDDAVRVWMDDKQVFEKWSQAGASTERIAIVGSPGPHKIKVDYFQLAGEYLLDVDVSRSEPGKETLAKRQANAAVALLRLNRPEKVWPMLRFSPDPRARTYLIHHLSSRSAPPQVIAARLSHEPDVTAIRALLLSLGEFSEKEFALDDRELLIPTIQELFRTSTDPGVHAASEWLLRQWSQATWVLQANTAWAADRNAREDKLENLTQLLEQGANTTPPQWYVSGQGQTFVIIPGPLEFEMGSPPTEVGRKDSEIQHKRRINRTFALCTQSVTVENFRAFQQGFELSADYVRLPNLPVVTTDFFQAAKYCNWYSQQEGLSEDQLCYEIKGTDIRLKANYLSLQGYRLPTEAEMEFAARAGAMTKYSFGESDELLSKYGWYSKNSDGKSWPVGSLKPNELGLFDMQGNVHTWCQNRYKNYPYGGGSVDDDDGELEISSTDHLMLRGGTHLITSLNLRAAARQSDVPANARHDIGIRLARTLK